MTILDPTELYLAAINAQPVPDAQLQFAWARQIDHQQQQFNLAVAADRGIIALLLEQYRRLTPSTRNGYVVARGRPVADAVGQTQEPEDQLLEDCMRQLEELVTTSACHDPRICCGVLQSLRLRSEFMLELIEAAAAGDLEQGSRFIGRAQQIVTAIAGLTDHLVRANQRLVAMLARQYRYGPLPFMDLVQEGNLGLLRAIERFDPEQGARISTYALWWIRRAMIYAIARQGRDVRPSVAQYWEARQVARVLDRMEPEQGRRVTHAEAAQRMGTSVATVHRALTVLLPPLALDAPIAATTDLSRMETLVATTDGPETNALSEDLRRSVAALLSQLPERQAKILKMRFGIEVRDDCTLEQIAQQQGVTRERIRQIEAQALAALRALDASWQLRGCVS